MDTKGLQKEFINWCKSKNKQPKSEDETKQLFVAFMKEKHPEEYKAAMENQQKQATKALHGAKLNYFKSLKHQCAEDEEVVYYKKGGSVTCGCKKKENGGEIPEAKCGAISKFKARKQADGGKQPKVVNGSTKQPTIEGTKKMQEDPNENMTWDPKLRKMRKMTPEEIAKAEKNRADARQGKGEGTPQHKCGGKVKKGEDGLLPIKNPKGKPSKNINRGGTKSKLPVQSKGSKINKNCGGSSIVSQFKKHRQGGSLNGIPFYQGGTPKLGVRTKKEVDAINESNKNRAKSLFKGIFSGQVLPTAENLGNMISSAYNGWVDPETIYLTGEAPNIGGKNLLSLGKPFKVIKGVNYYKNAAGELKTAQEMAKELIAAKKVRPSWFPKERHTDHYVPKNATGIYNELEKAAYEGEQMMKNPFMNWKDFDEINSVNYWKHGGLIRK